MTKPLFGPYDFGLGDAAQAELANKIHDERCPFRPGPDNEIGNEYAMVQMLKEECVRLTNEIVQQREINKQLAEKNTALKLRNQELLWDAEQTR